MKDEVVVYLSHLPVLCPPGPLSFLKLHVSPVHGRTVAFPIRIMWYHTNIFETYFMFSFLYILMIILIISKSSHW